MFEVSVIVFNKYTEDSKSYINWEKRYNIYASAIVMHLPLPYMDKVEDQYDLGNAQSWER